MLQAEELFDDIDAGGPIVAITELQNITLSPFLSRFCEKPPESYKEFVESSPKIHFVIEAIKQVRKDNRKPGRLFICREVWNTIHGKRISYKGSRI